MQIQDDDEFPILITAPLPPASGSSIGEFTRLEAYRGSLNASNSRKLGNFQTTLLGSLFPALTIPVFGYKTGAAPLR